MRDYMLHGDVFIVCDYTLPNDAEPIAEKVLEYGEVTGHAHRFHEDWGQVFITPDKRKFLRVIDQPIALKHEEHDTRLIPPGTYEIRRTKETDHMSGVTRLLAD